MYLKKMFGLDRGTQPQIKIGINHEEVDLDQLARLDSIANFAFDPSETDSTLLVEKRDQIAQYADDARLLIKFESGGLAVLSAGEIRRELEEDFVSTSRLHDNFFVVDDVNPDQKKAILEKRRNKDFFFQAEDGIRYWSVTGVQTCALPIYEVFIHIKLITFDDSFFVAEIGQH